MPYKDPGKQKEYQKIWYQGVVKKRREEWVKANGPCVDCGSWDDLEVDHTDAVVKDERLKGKTPTGSKRGTSSLWGWKKEAREAELKKCVVRCGDCHLSKSATEHPKWDDHYMAKLTIEQVRYVRYQSSDKSARQVAEELGVGKSCILGIRQGRRWVGV